MHYIDIIYVKRRLRRFRWYRLSTCSSSKKQMTRKYSNPLCQHPAPFARILLLKSPIYAVEPSLDNFSEHNGRNTNGRKRIPNQSGCHERPHFDLNSLRPSDAYWGRVTYICVSKLTIIGSDNGLSPGRRQAIIWTKAAILLIGPLETNLSEIWSCIQIF